jgi:hypothetical protein
MYSENQMLSPQNVQIMNQQQMLNLNMNQQQMMNTNQQQMMNTNQQQNYNNILIPVTNNQKVVANNFNLKSSPQLILCPNCGYNGYTRVAPSCNCANCCCCFFCSCIIWACFQCCRGKDLNCRDATHYCSKCNTLIGSYSAC